MNWSSSAILGVLILVVAYSYGADNTTDHSMRAGTPTAKPMGMMPMKIGDMCASDMDCTRKMGEWAQCTDHKCMCKTNYKPSSDMTKCNKNGAGYAFVSTTCIIMALVSKFVLQ